MRPSLSVKRVNHATKRFVFSFFRRHNAPATSMGLVKLTTASLSSLHTVTTTLARRRPRLQRALPGATKGGDFTAAADRECSGPPVANMR